MDRKKLSLIKINNVSRYAETLESNYDIMLENERKEKERIKKQAEKLAKEHPAKKEIQEELELSKKANQQSKQSNPLDTKYTGLPSKDRNDPYYLDFMEKQRLLLYQKTTPFFMTEEWLNRKKHYENITTPGGLKLPLLVNNDPITHELRGGEMLMMQKPEDYGVGDYLADAFAAFELNMNQALIQTFEGKKIRLGEYSDMRDAVDLAFLHEEELDLCTKYDNLGALITSMDKLGINAWKTGDIMVTKGQLVQQREQIRKQLSEMNGYDMSDFDIRNHSADLLNAHAADEKSKRDLEMTVGGIDNKILRPMSKMAREIVHGGIIKAFTPIKDQIRQSVDGRHNSALLDTSSWFGNTDTWFGDDVQEGLEDLRGYINADKETRKKMSENFNRTALRKIAYWDKMIEANRKDLNQWLSFHKVSDYFNNKAATADPSLITWNGILPSINSDAILYSGVQQLGYSASSWDKQAASMVLQTVASATTGGTSVIAAIAGGALGIQGGVDENNMEVDENFEQRKQTYKNKLREGIQQELINNNALPEVIAEMRMVYANRPDVKEAMKRKDFSFKEFCINEIAEGRYTPVSQRSQKAVADAEIDFLKKMRAGSNLLFDRDMAAVTGDELFDMMLYSKGAGKVFKGVGSATSKMANKGAKWVFLKMPNKGAAIKGAITGSKPYNFIATRLRNVNARDRIASTFSSIYDKTSSISPVVGTAFAATGTTAREVGRQVAKTKLWQGIRNSTIKAAERIRGTQFGQAAENAIKNGTEFVRNLPREVLDGHFTAQRALARTGHYAKQIGKFTYKQALNNISEAIEEGKQYQNAQEWVNSLDQERVESFWDTYLHDATTGLSLTTAALGVPFGARWGLAAKDLELYKNMVSGWLGGMIHNTTVMSIANAGNIKDAVFDLQTIALDRAIRENAYGDLTTSMNKFMLGQRLASLVAASPERFLREFDAFVEFNKQEREKGRPAYTDEELLAEREYAQRISNLVQNPLLQRAAKNAGIKKGSQEFGEFVSAYAQASSLHNEDAESRNEFNKTLNEAIDEIVGDINTDVAELSSLEHDLDGQLGNSIYNKLKQIASNAATGSKDEKEKNWADRILEAGAPVKEVLTKVLQIRAYRRLLDDVDFASNLSQRSGAMDVNWIKSLIQDRINSLLGDKASKNGRMLTSDVDEVLGLIEGYLDEDTLKQLDSVNNAILGHELQMDVSRAIMDGLLGNQSNRLSLRWYAKLLRKVLGLKLADPKSDAHEILGLYRDNLQAEYDNIDNVRLEYMTRQQRKEEEKRLAIIQEEADKRDLEDHLNESSINPLDDEILQEESQEQPQPVALTQPELPQTPPETPPSATQQPATEPQTTPTQPESQQPTPTGESQLDNRVFTEDALNDAVNSLKNILLGTGNNTVDSNQIDINELFKIGRVLFGYYMESGITSFTDVISNVYRKLTESGIEGGSVLLLAQYMRSWYGAAIYDVIAAHPDQFDQSSFDDAAIVAHTNVLAYIQSLIDNDAIEDRRKSNQNAFEDDVRRLTGAKAVVHSYAEVTKLKDMLIGDVVAVVTPGKHVYLVTVTDVLNGKVVSANDQDGIQLISQGTVLSAKDRNRLKRAARRSTSPQDLVFELLLKKIKKDNKDVVSTTDYHYVIKENGKLVLYRRVHTVLRDQYEELDDVVEDRNKLYDDLLDAITDRNFGKINLLLLNTNITDSQRDVYIDILKQDNSNDAEVAEALATIATRKLPGISVALGTIIDDLARQFFDSEQAHDLTYENCKVTYNEVEFNISLTMSKDKFEALLNDFQRFKDLYPGCKFSTTRHKWHTTITDDSGNKIHVAGETDMVGVTEDGRMFIVDFKTSKDTFTESTTTDSDGNTVPVGPFVDAHDLYTGQKARFSTKKQYARQLSLYLRIIQLEMPNVLFTNNPLILLPVGIRYRYRTAEENLKRIMNGEPVTLEMLFANVFIGRYTDPVSGKQEPLSIELPVQTDVVDGFFDKEDTNEDLTRRREGSLQEVNALIQAVTNLQDLLNRVINAALNIVNYVAKSLLQDASQKLIVIQEQLQELQKRLEDEQLPQSQIDEIEKDIAELTERIQELEQTVETRMIEVDELNALTIQAPVVDPNVNERAADKLKLYDSINEMFRLYTIYTSPGGNTVENYDKLSVAVKAMSDAADQFETKYGNTDEGLNTARKNKGWFDGQKRPGTTSQATTNRPQAQQPTSTGWGWRDHNTVDNRELGNAKALDDPSISLADCAAKPDFNKKAVFEYIKTSANKYGATLICHVTYDGHDFGNITIQVASNKKGLDILVTLLNLLNQLKQGQRIVLTGMVRTMGRIKDTNQHNPLDNKALAPNGIYNVSTETSLFTFGFGKWYKSSGKVRVEAYDQATGRSSMIYEFPSTRGAVGPLFTIVQPDYANSDGTMSLPIAHPILQQTINEKEALFLIDMLLSNSTPAYEVSIGNGVTDNIPLSHRDIISLFIPYGHASYVLSRTGGRMAGAHVYVQMNGTRAVFSGKNEHDDNIWERPFDLSTESGKLACVEYLQTVWILIDKDVAGCRLGQANNKNHPFKTLASWFNNPRHAGVDEIRIGDTRMVFRRADFKDPSNANDKLGMSGLAWLMRNGYLTTTFSHLTHPRVSFLDAAIEQESTDEDEPIAPQIDEIEEDATELEMDTDLDVDEFLDEGLSMSFVDEHKQRRKAKRTVTKEEAVKRLHKIFGKNVSVEVVENIADFVRNTSANAVGKVVGYTMYLAERALSGTEYHEAFHIVQDYLLPDSVNRQLMRGAKKAYAKKFGKEAAENATDKQLEEFCANQCASYFLKTEKIHFSLKHPFEYIQQHYEVFKHVGSFRMYLLYLTMSHGAFKMFDYSSEKQKKANKEHLKYQIRGVGMEHIYDDRMYNALIRSFVYYIMYMLNIESIGTNIDELDLSGDIVDKKLVRRKANGHRLTMSVREVLHASCKNPAGHAAIDELLDNWDVIKPDVVRYLDDIGIDYDEDAEKRREDLLNGDEDDINDTNHLDNHTKSSYETSHFARAKKGVRFFTSLIKEYFINDEGRPEPTRNELGLYQFMDNKEVINKMLGDCHDVTSVSELVERLAKLSKTSPMYKQIYLIIKQSYDHQTRKDGSLNANVEQFVTQVFNLISCTQNNFKRIQANRNRRTKLYTISIEDCGLEYEALTYRRDWGRMMLYGGTVLFDIDEDGKMVPSKKHPDAIKKLGAAYDLLDTIRNQFTELNIHNLLEKGAAPTLQIKYRGEKRTINVTNEDDLQILKTHIIDVFNTMGILVSRAEFEYYLKEKYKDCNSDFERMRAMFQDTREGAIYQLWLSNAGCPIKKVNGEWIANYDDNNIIYGTKGVHIADMYTSNSFMIGLSNAAYKYRHMTTELSVLVSKGDKYYVMSENNLISDVVNEMSKNKPFIDLLNKFCYNIITEKSENPDGTVSTNRIGSLLMKEVLGARESGSSYNMRICSPVMFKTDNNKDDGLGYFDISEREDYVLKANILENGYIILPTMSDKKTWCYIETGTGILPGIDYKADDEYFDISGTSAAEQLLEYALTERASIEQTLQQVDQLPDDEKVDNFHNGAVIEDAHEVQHQIANGTVFASLTGVYINGEYKSFNRMLDENGEFVGPKKNLELADKYFFSKSRQEQIAMLKELVSRQSDKEVEHMLSLGLIKKDELGQYVNVGLNNAAIMRIAKHIAGGNSVYPGHISQAIKVYAEDITYKSIMSLQEVERVFSGHPGFFKYKFDKKGRLVDRYSDEFKRFGGLISTGVKNNLEIKGLPEDGMYNQAEVDNDEIGSDQIDYIRKVMSEAEWKAVYRRIFGKEPDENVSIDKIKDDILGYDESIYKATEAAIDAETGSYAEKIDVADGGAYISPQMTEWLLRMCGEFDYKVLQAFKILMDPSKATDALAVAKSYKLIVTKVIGAQKYTAYGMRLSSDGKTTIPYYNKMALFPVFKCIATGEFAKIYEQMENHKDVHGNAMPIHLLAIKSAVKLGGQGSQKHSSDDSFTFNAYKQPFDRLRKQFNTNPHHKEDLSMGTQMVKVALAALNKTGEYIDARGRKVTGELMLKAIMDDIKLLGDIGNDEVHERLYDEDGHISVLKLSKFLNEILSSRDSDKSIIDTIQYDEDKDSLKRPLSACSRLGWLLSQLVSFINKKIAEIHTKGNAFFQRSIWKMEGPDVTIKDSSLLGNTINNGDLLLMIIEDGPAKGAMDCVLTIDYFNDVLKEAGLDKASFVEQKKALEEAGIIGKNAKAMFIGYRIPTQAVSSIHPLRCVDVLPVIQHNIFLPKEFTKITGSDFDIDKIFIASLNIKLQKNDDGWYNDVEAINEDKKLAAQDRLIKNYIEVLRHPDAANIQHRSIDNDTDLITNKKTGVLHEIYGDNISDETLPYDFYCMRTLTGTKNLFLTGKVGIGPYALNNNSHILTMLYNVSFGRDNIMSLIGFGSLHRTHDEDGNSILSWLSALINAHVDVAKDAYITKLNVNPMTYNLVSLLVRTGVGKNTFYFTTQPVMFEMANEYAKALGLFMQEEGKSKWAIRTEAKRKAAESYCGKTLVDEVESYMLDEKGNASEEGKEILEYILRNKDVLLTQARGDRSDVTLHLDDEDKTVSHKEFLAIIYACDKILEKPAQLISNLVQYTKIDTKKQGKNVSEQVNYLRGVAELFDDAEITEYLTGLKLDKNEIKSKKEYGFAKLGLKALYDGSFIGRKTKQAIFTFLDILSGLILESTPGFQVAVSAFMTRLGVEGVFNADAVSKALLAQIKSKAIMKWAMEQGIDPRSLVSGKDSLYDRLNKLKCRLQYDPDLEYLRYEDGTCKNALLLLLISDESWTAPVAENLHTDPIKELKFLRLFESLDINAAKRDYIIQAWQDLYEDDLHPELQQFAKDLFVYAFVTSGDRGGSTDLFSYAPNCIRDDSGYSSAIAQYILNLKDKGFGMAMLDEMFDDVVLNNYDDYTFCPTVKLDDLMLKSSAVRTVDSNGNVYTTKAPVIVVLDTVKFSGENERLAMGPLYIKVKNDGIRDKSSHRQYTVYKCIKRGEKCVYAKVNPKGYSVGRFNYYEFGEPSDTEFVVNEASLKLVDLSDSDLVQRLVAFYGNNIVKIIELLQGPLAKVLEDVDTTTKVSGTYPVPSAKGEDTSSKGSGNIVTQLIDHLNRSLKPIGTTVKNRADIIEFIKNHQNYRELVQLFIGKKARALFEKQLRKARPDMSDAEIKATLDFLHSLEDNKENNAYIKTAVRWVMNRSLTLPEDNTKARLVFDEARKRHIDIQKYPTLGALIASDEMKPKEKEKPKFDPDKAKTFSNKRTVTTEGGRVFTVYDVENTEEGQREVCKALWCNYATSPWCLSTFTATGQPTESAKHFWKRYSDIPRKIAFENGKPVAFSSNEANIGDVYGIFAEKTNDGWEVDITDLPDEVKEDFRELIRLGKAQHLSFYIGRTIVLIKDESLVNVSTSQEAWWDMEDRFPQEKLSDSIVSSNRRVRVVEDHAVINDDGDISFDDNIDFDDWLHQYNDTVAAEAIATLEADRLADEREQEALRRLEMMAYDELDDPYSWAEDRDNERIAYDQSFEDHLPEMYDYMQDVDQAIQAGLLDIGLLFVTPDGEIYGFVTPGGDIYLDESVISPEHPIHEYTHLWDRIVAKKNPKLWERGVELMKKTPLWDEIANSEQYGKRWKLRSGITLKQLENLIASEVHSRLVGKNGSLILDNIAKEKGSDNIVDKLKQWILDFWKDLKATLSNWSSSDLDKLTLEDFNNIVVRDFAEGDVFIGRAFNKIADNILATVAPFYNLTYDEYSKLDRDERENMRNKFHSAANKIALLLGLKMVSTTNLGSYLFKDGSKTTEISYTFQFNNANVDDVRLFSCLLGDIGYEDQESVITSRIAKEGETPSAMCAVIYINDVRAARKTLDDVGVKNFSLNADTKTITIYSFDTEDYDKVEELSLKLKENNNHGETKTAGAITTLDDRDVREKLYRTWLESHQNGPGKGSDLYNLVSTALRNVVVFGNKNIESGRQFVKPEGPFKEKLSELADLAFSVADKFGFKFKELNDASEDTSGRTMGDSATIGLNPRFDLGNTIFHEIIHSATVYLLPGHSFGATDGVNLPQNVLDAISRLDSLLFDAGEYIYRYTTYNQGDYQLLYSIQNLAEFIAELSNERLLEVLQNVGDVNQALDDCITIVKHADKRAFDIFSKRISTARKFTDAYKTATVFIPSKTQIEYIMNTLNSNADSDYVKLELSELDNEDVSIVKKNAAVRIRVGNNVLYGIWLTDRESAQSSGKATLVVLSPSYLSKNAIVTQKDNENFIIVKSLTPVTFDQAKVQDPFKRMLVQKAISKGVDHVYKLVLNEINKTLLEHISPTRPSKLTTLNIINRYTGEDGVPRYYLNKSISLAVDQPFGISVGNNLLDQKAKKVSEILTKVLQLLGFPEDFMWLKLSAHGYYLYINKFYLTQYNGLDSRKVRAILRLVGESCKTQCGL